MALTIRVKMTVDVCKHFFDNDSEQHGANSEEAEFNDEESDDDVENKDEVEY